MPLSLFNEIILLIIAAFIGGYAARSLSFPPVLGYLASGIFFGTIGAHLFPSYSSLVQLSQVGVALLLFTLGFEISFDSLKKINKRVILAGILQIFTTALFFIPLFLLFGMDFRISILFSALFSFSSTAVIVKILEEKGLLQDFPGNNVFIFLLIQDLFVVPVIFFLPLLFSKGPIVFSDLVLFLFSIIKTLAIFILIYFISKFLLPKITNFLFRYPSHELNILATIFIAFLSISLLSSIGLPQTIAAFLAGILISEEGKNLGPLSEIRPLRDILLVLFFVMTGMLINFPYVLMHLPQILALSILVLIIKFSLIYLLLRVLGYIPSSAIFISSYLANIGEFAAVIGQFSFTSSYMSRENYNILLSIFIFSLVLVPFSLRFFKVYGDRLAKFKIIKKILGEPAVAFNNFPDKAIENHVVICGHGRVGSQIRSLLDLTGIPYVIIDFNKNIISELTSKNKLVIYGDPTDDQVLRGAFIDKAKVLVLAVPDKLSQKKIIKAALTINPKISILCRTHQEEDRYELLNAGANSIVIPEFEAGLKIGAEVLEKFDIPSDSITFLIRRLRKDRII